MDLRICGFYTLYIPFLIAPLTLGINDEFIVIDGIRVRKSELINVRYEQRKKAEQARIKDNLEKEDAKLYNESEDITKHLPSKCQGLSMIA